MSGVLVVKCGGHHAVDGESIAHDVAELNRQGRQVVLVHGGSADIERLSERLGVPVRRQVSPDGVPSRHTDSDTLEVLTMALAGLVKPRLVGTLNRLGVRAVGLTGLDGGLLQAKRKAPQRSIVDGRKVLVRDNHAGTVHRVAADLLTILLDKGMVPVVSPPAVADDGGLVNVNADRVAAAIAGALNADQLILLTGAPGVLTDFADERSLLPAFAMPPSGPPPAFAAGGMALKLIAAREALRAGAAHARIADGRGARPVFRALAGSGTAVDIEG